MGYKCRLPAVLTKCLLRPLFNVTGQLAIKLLSYACSVKEPLLHVFIVACEWWIYVCEEFLPKV